MNPGIIEALDRRKGNIILYPTEACNFRCVYCYEEHAPKAMPVGVIEAIKKLIRRRMEDLDALTIGWFGGEPLLAIRAIDEISSFILAERKAFPGLAYKAHMSTNGYLLSREMFVHLCELGVSHFQVSLDGDADEHDKTRILGNGGGTFDRIWNNLVAISETDVGSAQILLRVHVLPSNTGSLPRLIEKINSAFGRDPRFKVFLKLICDLGECAMGKDNMFVEKDYEKISKPYYDMLAAEEMGYKVSEDAICYASMANSFAIRADGTIEKCTVALGEHRNLVGKLNEDGTVEMDNEKMYPWIQGLISQDDRWLKCPWSMMSRTAAPSR
jgi:uncharacterized protein